MRAPQPKRILVVDDMAIFRELLQLALRDAGYEVATAGDGIQALTAITHRRPDLIILDLKMPQMNGLALLRQIRENRAASDLPVIVLTSEDRIAKLAVARSLGVLAYLHKTQFSLRTLLARIERILSSEEQCESQAVSAAVD